jgi:hypothetical protein
MGRSLDVSIVYFFVFLVGPPHRGPIFRGGARHGGTIAMKRGNQSSIHKERGSPEYSINPFTNQIHSAQILGTPADMGGAKSALHVSIRNVDPSFTENPAPAFNDMLVSALNTPSAHARQPVVAHFVEWDSAAFTSVLHTLHWETEAPTTGTAEHCAVDC